MFGMFKRKSEKEKLEERYRKLLEEAHRLSTSDRKAADLKTAEAEEVLQRIEAMPD